MNIQISERALGKYDDDVMELMKRIKLKGEIDNHLTTWGRMPKKITIIRYDEDNNRLNPNKTHLILAI